MSCPARDVAACCSGGQGIQRSVTEVVASGKRDMDGGEAPLVICEECLPWPTRDEGSPTTYVNHSVDLQPPVWDTDEPKPAEVP